MLQLQHHQQGQHQHQPQPQGRKRRRTPSMASLILAASIACVLAGRGESSAAPFLARGGRLALNQGLTPTPAAAPAPASADDLAFASSGSFWGSTMGGGLARSSRRVGLAGNSDLAVGQRTSSSRRAEGAMMAAKGRGKAQGTSKGSSGANHKPPSLPQVCMM